MDAARKLIARRLFRGRVLGAHGAEYQRLFEQVMQHREPRFVRIKPSGAIGDRKNDGYLPDSGTYYQVYAPENPALPQNATKAAKKAAVDFKGLLEYWQQSTPVQHYRFVFNDKYLGSPPPLETALGKIRETYKIDAQSFLAGNLEDYALDLEEDQLADVLNCPIPEVGPLASVDYGILREVVAHVMESRRPLQSGVPLHAPDFTQKIQFNGLTQQVADLLRYAAYQIEAVDDFFSRNSSFAKQELRDHLSAIYLESRSMVEAQDGAADFLGDLVFFQLSGEMTPADISTKEYQAAAVQDAVFVVMAYYFEACDIFEDPDATS
jgi:C-terminal domain 10 of the ABC-three component (ABC-3C) systems